MDHNAIDSANCPASAPRTPLERLLPMRERSSGSFPDTRTTLIRRLSNDVGDAWRTFFDIYGPLVYRLARRAGLNENDAEDVLANVMRNFVQAVQRGFELDHSQGRFRSYLRTVTRHEVAAAYQAKARHPGLPDRADPPACDPMPDDLWLETERQQHWQTCLERLRTSSSVRSRDFEAFVRYALSGEPPDVVAKDLQITVDRLYGIKHAMIRKARRIWKQLEVELGEV